MFPYRHQPLKAVYLSCQFFTLLVRLPVWTLLALPKSWRPDAHSAHQVHSFSIRSSAEVLLIDLSNIITDTKVKSTGPLTILPNHLAITPGPDVNGVWVDPTPQLVIGQLKTWTAATSIAPARIPGYWMHKKGSALEVGSAPTLGEKVLYHLHGGGYIRLSAHPSDLTAVIARNILQYADSIHRSFSIEYRLSSHKPYPVENPFPAALLDALAGYNYLVNIVGYKPKDIIIAGDSAGGNLAHALTRYLVEHQVVEITDPNFTPLPAPPGGLLLLSPWCDLSTSHEGPGGSTHEFIVSDFIDSNTDYAKAAFLGTLGMGAAVYNPYISPASLDPALMIDFKGFPRTLIVSGGAEVYYDQIATLRDRMAKDLGDELTYYEAKDGVHDYLIFEWFEPERSETLKGIAGWV